MATSTGAPRTQVTATRFLVICPTAPGRLDGVADYACWLAASLAPHAPASLVGLARPTPPPGAAEGLPEVPRVALGSWRELWRRRREEPFGDSVPILQWVPQLYLGSREFSWLLLWLRHCRARGRPVVVTVHELAIPVGRSLRRAGARLAMEFALVALGVLATHLVATYGLTERRLRRRLRWKRRAIAKVPVGSNIPVALVADTPVEKNDKVVCTIFGQPEAMSAAIVARLGRQASHDQLRLRWLGRSSEAIAAFLRDRCGLPDGAFEVAAARPSPDVSRCLAASDLLLAPLVDGVSTRRTTVIAGLAHGLPIVGTDGPCTDDVWRRSGACLLTPGGDAESFVRNVALVASDAQRRAEMRRAARALFEAHFTWERIAGAYLAHLSRVA